MEKLSKMKRLVRVLDGLTAGVGSSSSPKDSDVVESLTPEHFNICKVGGWNDFCCIYSQVVLGSHTYRMCPAGVQCVYAPMCSAPHQCSCSRAPH